MNAHSPAKVATRSELWDVTIPSKLNAAIYDFDFGKSKAGIAIKKLFPNFKNEGFRIDADSTIIDKANWTTPGTIFLSVPYKADDGETRKFAEAFPMLVKFSIKGGVIEIKDIEANLTSLES